MTTPDDQRPLSDNEETLIDPTMVSRGSAPSSSDGGKSVRSRPGAKTSPSPESENATANRTISNKYRVESEIGAGGMGSVNKGFDISLQRPVAIKSLHGRYCEHPYVLRRFLLEAQIVGTLRHPNIVQVYEVIESDERPMIVMEYVDGMQFGDLVASGELSRERLVDCLITICDAVGFAHSRGILHRDIKPSNIMVTSDGHPKIMDFGIAKRLEEPRTTEGDVERTRSGMVLGSPGYMAPEQARGDHENLDNRADIYSLGGTIYQAFTGQAPIRGVSAYEILDSILHWQPPPPSQIATALPLDLEAICLKALSKNPKDRYQTAYEMADDLRRFRDGMPVLARQYSAWEKVTRAVRHEKRAFAIGMVAAAVMFAGILYAVTVLHRVSRASIVDELRNKVMGIAVTASMVVDPAIVERIRSPADIDTPECRQLVALLSEIKKKNDRIEYIWVMRRSEQRPGFSEFVAENDTLADDAELDQNHNGVVDAGEQRVVPGMLFEESMEYPELHAGYSGPAADRTIGKMDQWGVSLSGYAPIRDANGNSIAVLGVDMRLGQVHESFTMIDRVYRWIVALALVVTISLVGLMIAWITSQWTQKAYTRKIQAA